MKKYSDDLITLIRHDYENGRSISQLSQIYKVPKGTIKDWSSKNSWVKKKANQPTVNQPTNQLIKSKDVAIKLDILDGIDKEVVMERNGIKKSTYYSKKKSIRHLTNEKTEKILKEAADYAYPDGAEMLKKVKGKKRNLMVNIISNADSNLLDKNKQEAIGKALSNISKIELEIMKDLGIVSLYKQLEIDRELRVEEQNQERIEIERSKLKDKTKETEEDKKVEIKIIGVD